VGYEERTASLPVRFGPPIDDGRDWAEIECEADSERLCVSDFDGNVWYLEHMYFVEDYTDIVGNVHHAWVPEGW
jgi:hypothetical protein